MRTVLEFEGERYELLPPQTEQEKQIAQFQILREQLAAGDIESVDQWLAGAIKTLGRDAGERV